MRLRNGVDHGLNLTLSVRFGSRQCSQNDSGKISGDLSCMCPVASVAGRVRTAQVHIHLSDHLRAVRDRATTRRVRPLRSGQADGAELALGFGGGFVAWGSFEDHTDGLCGGDVVGRRELVADGLHGESLRRVGVIHLEIYSVHLQKKVRIVELKAIDLKKSKTKDLSLQAGEA